MASQFDLTWLYDVIIRNSVFQLGFVTRKFQITTLHLQKNVRSIDSYQIPRIIMVSGEIYARK